MLLGNYNGIPTHTVSILEGLKKEFAGASISYMEGTGFLSKQSEAVPASVLTTDGRPGAAATYMKQDIGGLDEIAPCQPVASAAGTVEQGIELGRSRCPPARPSKASGGALGGNADAH